MDERRRTGRVHKKSFERKNLVCDSKVDEKSLIELQELSGEDQSRLLSRLVDKGLADRNMDIAVDFIKDKVSLAKSASIAGVSLWRFLDELRKRNVVLKYSLSETQAEI